jgi:hypothetical protein
VFDVYSTTVHPGGIGETSGEQNIFQQKNRILDRIRKNYWTEKSEFVEDDNRICDRTVG